MEYKELINSLWSITKTFLYNSFVVSGSSGFNVLSSLASVVTIGGVVMIIIYYMKIRISRKCRKEIIADLVRHLFVNCAILEVIRINIMKNNNIRPVDGVFQRMTFLDIDTDLCKFSITSKKFSMVHESSLIIRNYNIVAQVAEKHFADPNIDINIKINDLDDLFSRGVEVTKKLLELGNCFHLGTNEKFLIENIKNNKGVIRTGIWSIDIAENDIPLRCRFKNHSFYDKLGLCNKFNECVLCWSTMLYYIPINYCYTLTGATKIQQITSSCRINKNNNIKKQKHKHKKRP